jgi:hypothetical protein
MLETCEAARSDRCENKYLMHGHDCHEHGAVMHIDQLRLVTLVQNARGGVKQREIRIKSMHHLIIQRSRNTVFPFRRNYISRIILSYDLQEHCLSISNNRGIRCLPQTPQWTMQIGTMLSPSACYTQGNL